MIPNFAAYLATLSHCEGTDRAADPYRCCYKFIHVIQSFAYHPAERRPPDNEPEWKGESIADLGPEYVGEVSTAAGRLQINLPTYLDNKRQMLGVIGFDPATQNDIGINIIRRLGALDDVRNGAIADAMFKCRNTWASLPGGRSHQPERSVQYFLDHYAAAGGALKVSVAVA